MEEDFWSYVRDNVIGRDAIIGTPYGKRAMLYVDHTASGRSVQFIEDYLHSLFPFYGNTHTDDDFTGNFSTSLLEKAIDRIKELVHAGKHHKLILTGNGATGAIEKLQQILGVYLPPATRDRLRPFLDEPSGDRPGATAGGSLLERRPVVFVGPYEHHSNEVTWRECVAEVVEIGLTSDGLIDLEDLKAKLSLPAYANRQKIGSFSAASNVSGVRSDVYAIARILHQAGALACFDFAALAPYAPIDVNHDGESYFDAVVFSPHKFLGGPGASGALIIHEKIYRSDLPPTHGGGGTVDFVSQSQQHYLSNIEGREMAGTPGIPQVWKAALAMELKELLGPQAIEERERRLTAEAYRRVAAHPKIEVIGAAGPEHRIGILSFLIRDGASYLHPRFVARLLNDLFGIQSRGGCSCAGPYGHRVLSIGDERSEQYRLLILQGKCGIKPGWTRVTLHFLLSDEELDFLCEAILFVADAGRYFLPLYRFDLYTGSWKHLEWNPELPQFSLEGALARSPAGSGKERSGAHPVPGKGESERGPLPGVVDEREITRMRTESMSEAHRILGELKQRYSEADIRTLKESPFPFEYYESSQ